jgi:uncharacterized membrane protein
MSTTVVGHMAVTLVSPAALTEAQSLRFENINLNNTESLGTECNMTMGSVKVKGNTSTYSVTVSGGAITGNGISVDQFTATSNTDASGASNILIGGTLSANQENLSALAQNEPLAVTVNFN